MKLLERIKGLLNFFVKSSRAQVVLLSTTGLLTLGGLGVGGYVLYENFNSQEAVIESNVTTEMETELNTEQILVAVTEETEAIEETETESETETETETEMEPVLVKLAGSSIERDLKIKIQDENKKNIKGEDFHIAVARDEANAKASIYNDHDQDGIIYIKEIEDGDYIVSLNEIEGYYTEKENIKVTVKAKIEYVEVEVQDEIKTEAEVAPSEDAEQANVEVEAAIKDTVESLNTGCTATVVSAGDINREKYITSAPSLGTAITKILPETSVVAYRKNIMLVGTELSEGISGQTEENIPEEITCIITHEFTDGSASVAQEVKGVAGTVVSVNQYEGYTSDYTGGANYTIKEGENAITIRWTPIEVAPAEIICVITHEFTDGSASVAQEVKGVAGTVVSVNQYEGYTSDYTGGANYTIKEGETAFLITWTPVAPVITASVSMPGTANLFVSNLGSATTLTLALAIEDNNETKIVDTEGITWSLKNDSVGGIVLSATTGTSISVSTTNGTSKPGTVTVMATIPYAIDGNRKSTTLECVVTVKTDTYDTTKVLTDNTNAVLYTDDRCTVTASVADLVEKGVTTFYKEPKYTGWQTLNGKLYYYNSQNQPVTGEQVISGVRYTFGADGAMIKGASSTGIDVSKWQGNIDWNAVKAAGIEFAIIRVGYRGSESGVLVEDPYYRQNINGATAAGLKVGVYFFTQATTEAEAVEEASMALSLTQGYNLAYPIFVDTEKGSGNARANGLDKATRTACINAFCKTIQNGGRTAGVYASRSWYNSKLDTSQLNNYCIWVAQYNTECTYKGRYSIWQYSSTGKIPGIKGNVDLNISYM